MIGGVLSVPALSLATAHEGCGYCPQSNFPVENLTRRDRTSPGPNKLLAFCCLIYKKEMVGHFNGVKQERERCRRC